MTTLDDDLGYVDPSNVSIWPTALRYGLIGGLVMIIFSLIMILTGLNFSMQWLTSVGSLVIFGAILYFAMVKHRDEDLGGYLKYGRALGLGVATAIIIGVLSVIFNYVYMEFVDPSLMETALEMSRERLEAQGMEDEQIDQAMSMSEKFMSPGAMAIMGLLFNAFFGFIASLIVGAIAKKNPPGA
ncbi:MAG: DUF4199 domain-containing protein [Bacteroidetes bacterium]|nr:DUF4199 domain-containing protein [Bacteroidota bacterium]